MEIRSVILILASPFVMVPRFLIHHGEVDMIVSVAA